MLIARKCSLSLQNDENWLLQTAAEILARLSMDISCSGIKRNIQTTKCPRFTHAGGVNEDHASKRYSCKLHLLITCSLQNGTPSDDPKCVLFSGENHVFFLFFWMSPILGRPHKGVH